MAVLAQLRLDGLEVLDRVRAVERLEVEHVHEQPAALHVGEELVAEPGAGARSLDQPGDVGHHELAVVALERAEHRLEGREGVVGHLRLRARDPGEQRRLARVRKSHESGVGHQPQLQLERALLAREAALGEARALPRGRGELLVAATAAAAAVPRARAAPGSRGPSDPRTRGPPPPSRAPRAPRAARAWRRACSRPGRGRRAWRGNARRAGSPTGPGATRPPRSPRPRRDRRRRHPARPSVHAPRA